MKKNKKSNKLDLFKNLFLIFMIGCIGGWIYEEIYFFVVENKILYRGFLWGPWLPVYGVGIVIIDKLLSSYKKHPSIIFLGTVLITGIIEYITGFLLNNFLNTRYWDYRLKPFNISGYVCLESVLLFGLLVLLFIYVIKPIFEKCINKIGEKNKDILFYILFSLFIIDLIVSIFYRCPFGIV